MAWAEGGLQGEAGGSTTQPLSASHRHRGSVKVATGHAHIGCIVGHHFIVKRQQRRIGCSGFCKCYHLERDRKDMVVLCILLNVYNRHLGNQSSSRRLQSPLDRQHTGCCLQCKRASSIWIQIHRRRSTESTPSRKSSYLLNKSYKKLKKFLLHVMKLFLPSTEDDSSTPTSILMLRIDPASGEDEGLAA